MRVFDLLIKPLISLLFMVICLESYSQVQSSDYLIKMNDPEYTDATAITFKNEEIKGLVPSIILGSGRIFMVLSNGETLKLLPNEISSIETTNNKFVSDGNLFFKVMIESPHVSLFCIETTPVYTGQNGFSYSGKSSDATCKYYLRKGSGEITALEKGGFKKKYMEYFWNCPRVVERIRIKALGADQIWVIVNLFNDCMSKDSD